MKTNLSARCGKAVRVLCAALLASMLAPASFAFADINDNRYDIGTTYNTGLDTGYWDENYMGEHDPHITWELGQFLITGYYRVDNADTNNPTFIVAPGGSVTLLYKLEQNLELINSDPALSINEDENGSDRTFGIGERNFGRGALFISRTVDGQETVDATYDFLGSIARYDEEVDVGEFTDGSYRVSLDYELREDILELLGISIFPEYTNYKNTFFFNVRTEEPTEALPADTTQATQTDETATGQSGNETIYDQPTETITFKLEIWQIAIISVATLIAGFMVLRSQWGPVSTWRKKKK